MPFRRGATLRGGVTVESAILFDFGGTLDADGLPWKTRFFQLCRDQGMTTSSETFDPVFYSVDDALVGAIPPSLSFRDTVWRLATDLVAALGGRGEAAVERVATGFLDSAREQLRKNAALLGRLARRYRLGLVSNFYGNLAAVCEDAEILPFFGVVVDSTRVGVTKPDPRIFRSALDALGVPVSRATFVGDSLPRDMMGARALGLRHIWLAGAPVVETPPCCPGDAVIRRLTDVEPLVA